MFDSDGRSPRMRGSLDTARVEAQGLGAIPAHAGEPFSEFKGKRLMRGDPRACGGATSRYEFGELPEGRSPRMRGSQRGAAVRALDPGAIPAHAGEPQHIRGQVISRGGDPRACGGALRPLLFPSSNWGRSPRMRGSLDKHQRQPLAVGAIPAHAGEPRGRWTVSPTPRGDPRACGGAPVRAAVGRRREGDPRLGR